MTCCPALSFFFCKKNNRMFVFLARQSMECTKQRSLLGQIPSEIQKFSTSLPAERSTRRATASRIEHSLMLRVHYGRFVNPDCCREWSARLYVEALQKYPCPAACAGLWRQVSLLAMTRMWWVPQSKWREGTDCAYWYGPLVSVG